MKKYTLFLAIVVLASFGARTASAKRFQGPQWTCEKVAAFTITRPNGRVLIERVRISATSEGELAGAPIMPTAYAQANDMLGRRYIALRSAYAMIENVPQSSILYGPDIGIPQLCHDGPETAEIRKAKAKWPSPTWPRAESGTTNCRGIVWWKEQEGEDLSDWHNETLESMGEKDGATIAQSALEETLRKNVRPKRGTIVAGPTAYALCWAKNQPKPFDPPIGWRTGANAPDW